MTFVLWAFSTRPSLKMSLLYWATTPSATSPRLPSALHALTSAPPAPPPPWTPAPRATSATSSPIPRPASAFAPPLPPKPRLPPTNASSLSWLLLFVWQRVSCLLWCSSCWRSRTETASAAGQSTWGRLLKRTPLTAWSSPMWTPSTDWPLSWPLRGRDCWTTRKMRIRRGRGRSFLQILRTLILCG